jgi:hypothetical protein
LWRPRRVRDRAEKESLRAARGPAADSRRRVGRPTVRPGAANRTAAHGPAVPRCGGGGTSRKVLGPGDRTVPQGRRRAVPRGRKRHAQAALPAHAAAPQREGVGP